MQLAILGTGNVARTLARSWSAAGHEITFGSREPASRRALEAPVVSASAAVRNPDCAYAARSA
jgi:predicted dinucleotide-binding enzyme